MRDKLPEMERQKILPLSQEELFSGETEAQEALNYLIQVRKFDKVTLEKFSVGYMPSKVRNCEGKIHELAGRIMLPIKNQYGDLVAFSSRDWRENGRRPFWHESYNKGYYLYGLDVAKRSIIKNKKAVLVEGEFDVMKLHQHNISCTVAVNGSAPQLHQIALLRRYCKEIFLAFDSDEAGLTAIKRLKRTPMSNYFGRAFLDVRLIPVFLPKGMDPDDYMNAEGREAFVKILRKSKKDYYSGKKYD